MTKFVKHISTKGLLVFLSGIVFIFAGCGGGGSKDTNPTPGDPLDSWKARITGIAVPNSKVVYGNGTYVAFNYSNTNIYMSSDGSSWIIRTSGISNSAFSGITYGNGAFVVVGDNGTIITSGDGVFWSARTSGTSSKLLDVTYGNGIYVVLGSGGRMLTSSDGTIWESAAALQVPLNAITYANNKFIAVGDGGAIFTSDDGKAWISRNSETNSNLSAITYGNGIFVAVGNSGTVVISSDGSEWSASKLTLSNDLTQAVFGNDIFIALDGGSIFTSNDGFTWTSNDVDFVLRKISFANHTFIAFGSGPNVNTGAARSFVYKSADGTNWNGTYYGSTPIMPPGQRTLEGIAYGNNMFVATGSTTLISPDGITWTVVGLTDEIYDPRGVTYAKGINHMFVIFGDKEQILTSPDGFHWTKRNLGFEAPINGMVYGNGVFVAVGGNGKILTSQDGANWTSRNSGISNILRGITYGKNSFVAVGDAGSILTSPDGISWTFRDSQFSQTLYGIAYGNGTFVAAGENSLVTSGDGIHWTTDISGVTSFVVTYGKGYFVTSSGLTSSNGGNWKPRNLGNANTFYGLAFGNSSFVMVGTESDATIIQSDQL